MEIMQAQSQYFRGKKRFLNSQALSDMQFLLNRMNSRTTYQESKTDFSSKLVGGLSIQEKAFFSDKRYLLSPAKKMFGISTLEFGNVKLTFDNQTGEIIEHKKPFFKSWKKTLKQAGELLSKAKSNFDNASIIVKKVINISGFTNYGAKKLSDISKNIKSVILEPLNGVF